MSTASFKIPLKHEFGRDSSQGGHNHDKAKDTHSRPPYPESDHSYSSYDQEKIGLPAYNNNSEPSIEEIRREFFPPGAEPYHTPHWSWYTLQFQTPNLTRMDSSIHQNHENDKRFQSLDDKLNDNQDRDSVSSFKSSEPKGRSPSRNDILLAAVGGAALAIGGKGLWDRRKPKKHPVKSNAAHTAAIGAIGALAGYEGAEIYSKYMKKERKLEKYHISHQSKTGDRYRTHNSKSRDDIKSRRSVRRQTSSSYESSDLSSSESSHEDEKYSFETRGNDSSGSTTRLQKLATTALIAGATEAFKVRKEHGRWSGDKGKRVLTAAIGASAIDAVAEGSGKRQVLETIIRGLASSHLINGSRNQDDNRSSSSRSRHRSRSRSLKKNLVGSISTLLAAEIGALATGRKSVEKSRSRPRMSRSRRRHKSPSLSSSSSSSMSRNTSKIRHQRSKSFTDTARKGLAAFKSHKQNEYEQNRNKFSHQRSYRSGSSTDFSRTHNRYHDSVDHNERRNRRPSNKVTRDENSKSKKRETSRVTMHRSHNKTKNNNKKTLDNSDSCYSSRSSIEDDRYIMGTRVKKRI